MSMVAIFYMYCCDQEIVFGHCRGNPMNPPSYVCQFHGRCVLNFKRYMNEKLEEIPGNHAWRIPKNWQYDEKTHGYAKHGVPQGTNVPQSSTLEVI